MILINLLPHREEKRKRRKAAYFTGLALGAVGGVLVAGLWYAVLEQQKSAQMERNAFLSAEITKLEAQIKDIANLRAEIEALLLAQDVEGAVPADGVEPGLDVLAHLVGLGEPELEEGVLHDIARPVNVTIEDACCVGNEAAVIEIESLLDQRGSVVVFVLA